MSKVHFEVEGLFEMASTKTRASVTIDRERGIICVRPLRSRQTYIVPLAEMCELIVRRQIAAQVAENKPKRRVRTVKRGLLSM